MDEVFTLLLRVYHLKHCSIASTSAAVQYALVANLATGLGVERTAIKNQ